MSSATIERETTTAPAGATYDALLAEARRAGQTLVEARAEVERLTGAQGRAQTRLGAIMARLTRASKTKEREQLHGERVATLEEAEALPHQLGQAQEALQARALDFTTAIRRFKDCGQDVATAHYQDCLREVEAAQVKLSDANAWSGHFLPLTPSTVERRIADAHPTALDAHLPELFRLLVLLEEAVAARPEGA